MPSIVVRGVDITSTEILPGCVLVVDQSLAATKALRELCELLELPQRYAATAVPQEAFKRDVDFHATPKSSPYSVARVPVLLSTAMGALRQSERFVVRSVLYNPEVHTGDSARPLVTLKDVVGYSVFGLDIVAHNVQGLKAACRWCSSAGGREELGGEKFEENVQSASAAAHYARDKEAAKQDLFKKGDVVLQVGQSGSKGGAYVVVKVIQGSVQIVDEAGKKLWVKEESLALSDVQA